jgi:hypothetical protein
MSAARFATTARKGQRRTMRRFFCFSTTQRTRLKCGEIEMADNAPETVQPVVVPNVPGDGQQPVVPPKVERTFSESEFHRLLDERLTRERQKYADYDELKKAQAELKKLQERDLSEADKLKAKLAEAESQRDAAMALANERLIRSSFISEASKLGAMHPGDAYALADLSKVEISDDGNVAGAAEAVAELVKSGRLPVKTAAPAPPLDGGAGSGKKGEGAVPIDEEALRARAVRLGVNPDEFVKRQKAILAAQASARK